MGFGFTVPDDDDFAVMVHDEAIRMFGRSRFDSGAGVHFQYLLVNRRRLAGDLRLHESSEPAMRLLSLAYRSAGLLWAARASCIFAIASIFIEAEEDSDLPASVVPTLMLLGWITVELRHLPDAFEAIRLVRGCVARLPLDDASKERAAKRLQEFDLVLGSH